MMFDFSDIFSASIGRNSEPQALRESLVVCASFGARSVILSQSQALGHSKSVKSTPTLGFSLQRKGSVVLKSGGVLRDTRVAPSARFDGSRSFSASRHGTEQQAPATGDPNRGPMDASVAIVAIVAIVGIVGLVGLLLLLFRLFTSSRRDGSSSVKMNEMGVGNGQNDDSSEGDCDDVGAEAEAEDIFLGNVIEHFENEIWIGEDDPLRLNLDSAES
jgi:hypothetical protein